MRKLKLLLAAAALMVGGMTVSADELDITSLYITNPGFELGNTNGWTVGASSDTGARSTTNGTYAMSNSEGAFLFNTWWKGIPITQTAAGLPAGNYTLSAVLASDGATVYLIAGDDPTTYAYTETTNSGVGILVSKNFTLTEATDFKIGAIGGADGTAGEHKDYTADGYWWYKADNFKLVLNLEEGATIPDAIVTKLLEGKPTGKMSTSVETALNTAISTFESNATLDNYNAALAAMAKARTSIASYAAIEAGTISTAELGNWTISTPAGALAVNTWSNEGATDGSTMTTPFIQDWVGSGTALGAGKLYYRLEGLNPGEKYSVSALVRVLDESGAAVSGATFYVNGETKDIAANGSACTNGIAGTMNLAAEVDENGVLEIGIESASTATFNWMAIKDVTIAEFAGIQVSNIELSQTTATLTTGDALTLTATVTPDNADDKTFTWTSSDETVATVTAAGIVSALAAGTATITATANDGSGVSASCTITVANATAPAFYSEVAAGKFLIINAATGKALGGANSYGTHASLIEHAAFITFTADGDNFKLTNFCATSNGLGSNAYVDNGTPAALTFTKKGNGAYTMTLNGKFVTAQGGTTVVSIDGTDAESALAQWYLIDEATAKKNLASASNDNPVDVTYYIGDPNFSRNVPSTAWTMTANNQNLAGGADYNQCAESWQSSNGFTLKQELSVPNGTYKLRAQAGASGNYSNVFLYANDNTTSFNVKGNEGSMSAMSESFNKGLYYTDWIEVTVTDHKLTVGAKTEETGSWCLWDNFELYMTNYIPVTSITASIDNADIEAGQTAQITAAIEPTPASFDALTYTSSDETIATVNESGVVTGVGIGEATITVAAEVEDISKTVAVTVTAVAPTALELSETEVALDASTTTATLTVTPTPAEANTSVTWTSSDETVATVADGVVTAVSTGTATITATSTVDTEVKAEATVTVTFPESTVPEFVNNGPARTEYDFGPNLIKNGSFEYPDNFFGWMAGNGAKMNSSNFGIQTSDAFDGNNYLKASKDKGQTDAGSIYTSWPVEAGKTYVFSYQMKNSTAISNDDYIRTSLSATTSEDATSYNETFKAVSCGTDWTELSYQFTVPEGKNYLVFSARWLKSSKSFDNFYLCEVLGEPTTVGNVEYATAAIPTANIGTGAFQFSQNAIDAANALVQGQATVEDVENAYEAVTTLNTPEATQAYNLVFNCEGHSATGNALTLIPNPDQAQGLYGLKYLAPANENLAQAFYFVHTTGNKYKVYAYDQDENERYITTQAEGYGTTWYDGIRTIDDVTKAMEIEIRPNGEGLYLLWNTGANKAMAHNGNTNNDLFTNNTANFQFNEVESKASISVGAPDGGYATTMVPFAVAELPDGLKAYTCNKVEGEVLTLEEVTALEANKPYIVEGTSTEVTGYAKGTALTYTEGLLTGVYAGTNAPTDSYVLQDHDGVVGFYKVGDAAITVPANRAYVPSQSAGVRAFFFPGTTTGITALQMLLDGNSEIYDMNGVRTQQLQKGMNIIRTQDGTTRKIMVK